MSILNDLSRQGRYDDLWQLCCGFINLDLQQFMSIQKSLMLEQIELLGKSSLGRKLMGGNFPRSIAEFREKVRLSTYLDYCPELLDKREDVLPVKPLQWIQTSGRSGEYPFKWIPVTQRFWEEAELNFCAILLFGSCDSRGNPYFKYGLRWLHASAQPPFLTGLVARSLAQNLGLRFLPELQYCEHLSFDERVEKGFSMALNEGMDGFFGLAGILIAIAEKFNKGSNNLQVSKLVKQPKMALRLGQGRLKSKLQGRRLLPKDLWNLKVIVSMGTDSLVYKDKIKEMWGRSPLDVYGNSETTVVATQTWDYGNKVFFPNLNFLEFIPESEVLLWERDKQYQPKTVLLDEVKQGENYELVVSNFHGGIMVRYRLGDIIKITALRNDKLGINLPQMAFERRADDLIDLGFMRLTERIIWQALENSGIPYRNWMARKEIGKTPKLRIFLETDGSNADDSSIIADQIYSQIKKLDDGLYVYKDISSLEKLIDFKPIEVTLLKPGVFSNYKTRMRDIGADSLHQRPPHLNPSESIVVLLDSINKDNSKESLINK